MRRDDDLRRFPRPNVAVDVAVLTLAPSERLERDERHAELAVLVQDRDAEPRGSALPGRFLREHQRVASAIGDVFRDKVGVALSVPAPRLLRVFDEPDRDPRSWTISLAHAVALPYESLQGCNGRLVRVDRRGRLTTGEDLLFDHGAIVREAAAAVRERYEQLPDPDGFLGTQFTLADLRACHEAVLGAKLLKDTFNRRMTEQLRPVVAGGRLVRRSRGGRPARVFTRAPAADVASVAIQRLRLPRDTS